MEQTGNEASINPFDSSFWADPYYFYPKFLAKPPAQLSLFLPTVLVARYRDVVSVLGDPLFSSCVPQFPFIPKLDPFGGAPTMLFSDPPVHTRLRRLAASYFRSSTIEELGFRIRAITCALLDRITAKDEFDAVADLAVPLPVAINAEILGLPVDHQPMLREWSDEIFASVRRSLAVAFALVNGQATGGGTKAGHANPALSAIEGSIPESNADAIAALREYFIHEIERRRVNPGSDLVSAMVTAPDSDPVTVDELLALVVLLLFAGSETTTNLIANGLLALTRHRDQWERLKSAPQLIPTAVEEILRYDSPVQMLMRFSTTETSVAETSVPRGAALLLMLGAANRDPARFHQPECLDIGRHPNPHVAFGDGIHTCIGSQLARLEGRSVIGAMLERFPALSLRDPSAPLRYDVSLLSRGLSSLPMATG